MVFQRPLPYLYLARQVFADARIGYQAVDALPLAAEPFAAALDLLFTAAAAGFTRGALMDLLRSPHFTFAAGADLDGIDTCLRNAKFFGTIERLESIADDHREVGVAAEAARSLTAVFAAPTTPAQIEGLLAFIAAHEQLPEPDAPWRDRHLRARAAVLDALQQLRDGHAGHDDAPLSIAELAGAVRRWIDSQTFSPKVGRSGVRLMDVRAAAYADIDDLRLVGLVESDWPERSRRSIFYPQSLLTELGWPQEADRLAAERARFADLLRLPRHRVSVSAFTLEDDSIVSGSPFLEDIDAVGLSVERAVNVTAPARLFSHEALRLERLDQAVLEGSAAGWLALRRTRPVEAPRFRGHTGPRPEATYSVSRVERYLECPFRYFAATVLKLSEERDEQAWLSPRERGDFVHKVFHEFFTVWQQDGRGAITAENVADAVARFGEIAEAHIARLPEGDRALERTLLLGSAAAAGLAERAFAFEIEQGAGVRERLLEHDLVGTFTLTADGSPRDVRVRAKADRIDLLADGTLRIVDYKLGRAPDRKRSLQLPIYGVCAEQALDGRHGRAWTVSAAGYVAFKEKVSFSGLGDLDAAMASGQERFLAAVDGIERGAFPVQPDDLFLCNWCAYPGVCRKDYVGDE